MKIDILTLFPKMFKGPFDESIVKRAQDKGLVEIKIHDLRRWTKDKRRTVDARPFGGGVGMVLMVEPVYKAVKALRAQAKMPPRRSPSATVRGGIQQTGHSRSAKVILLTPQGKIFNQKNAQRLAKEKHLIFICGHYEGVDERIKEHLIDEEISIGDYILTGGELPAMVVVDTTVRLIPRVLEKAEATKNESFSPLLEYPQYTRPANFKGWKVPAVLLSGNHQKIGAWREKQSLTRTKIRRPDLL